MFDVDLSGGLLTGLLVLISISMTIIIPLYYGRFLRRVLSTTLPTSDKAVPILFLTALAAGLLVIAWALPSVSYNVVLRLTNADLSISIPPAEKTFALWFIPLAIGSLYFALGKVSHRLATRILSRLIERPSNRQ
jgi:hypothetical protein